VNGVDNLPLTVLTEKLAVTSRGKSSVMLPEVVASDVFSTFSASAQTILPFVVRMSTAFLYVAGIWISRRERTMLNSRYESHDPRLMLNLLPEFVTFAKNFLLSLFRYSFTTILSASPCSKEAFSSLNEISISVMPSKPIDRTLTGSAPMF
jgi:hypothetical protein